jgi:YggT family protein
MAAIGNILILLLDIYMWIIIIHVAIGWLVVFDVINVKSGKAQSLIDLLNRATEPVYKPIRQVIKPIGGIDISPIVVILGIFLLQMIIASLFFRGAIYY